MHAKVNEPTNRKKAAEQWDRRNRISGLGRGENMGQTQLTWTSSCKEPKGVKEGRRRKKKKGNTSSVFPSIQFRCIDRAASAKRGKNIECKTDS